MYNIWLVPFLILWLVFGVTAWHDTSKLKHVKKVIQYLLVVFGILGFAYFVVYEQLIRRFSSPIAWITFLSFGLIALWWILLSFKNKLIRAGISDPRRGRRLERNIRFWGITAEMLVATGTLILAGATMLHIRETTRIVSQIELARKEKITPQIMIDSTKYGFNPKSSTPQYLYLFIKNIGEGHALDLHVLVERCNVEDTSLTKRYAGPCGIENVQGETFEANMLTYLARGDSRRIPISLSKLYKEEIATKVKAPFWQTQRFKAYLFYEDFEEGFYKTSQEVHLVPTMEDIYPYAAYIDTSNYLKHQDNKIKPDYRKIEKIIFPGKEKDSLETEED